MLKREINKTIVAGFLLLLACKTNKPEDKLVNYENYITERVGKNLFDSSLYRIASDSIATWVKNKLKYYNDCRYYPWKLDSCFCYNTNKTKFYTALHKFRHPKTDSDSDNMAFFYGAKINSKWYFFRGASVVIPHEYYIDTNKINLREPFNYNLMHQAASQEILFGYLKCSYETFHNKQIIKCNISKNRFDQMYGKNPVGKGYGSCLNCKTEEEYVIYLVKKNWREKDTTLNLE